jgi:hypothetical protein
LPDFSLKTTSAWKFFFWLLASSARLWENISKAQYCTKCFYVAYFFTKREAKVNKNCGLKNCWLRATNIWRISVALSRNPLLTLASRFAKKQNLQHKILFWNIYPWRCFIDVFLYWPTKTFLCKSCFQREIRQNVHLAFHHFWRVSLCLLEG